MREYRIGQARDGLSQAFVFTYPSIQTVGVVEKDLVTGRWCALVKDPEHRGEFVPLPGDHRTRREAAEAVMAATL